jgi:predicted PurR-regulated permease PerM
VTSIRLGALAWVALALSITAAYTLAPLLLPVIFAAWTATIARPLLERLARGMKGRRSAAAVLVTTLILVMVAIATLLVIAVVSGSSELWDVVIASKSAQSAVEAIVSPGSDSNGEALRLPKSMADLLPWLEGHSTDAFRVIGGVAGAAVKSIIGSIIFFFGVWTFLVEGPRAWEWALAHLPLAPHHLRRLGAAFTETGRGLLIGVGLTNASQALTAIVVYLALGVPRAVVLGLLTGLSGFVPITGTALVWAPVAAGLYFTGYPVKAVVMVVFGLVISLMDNVLRPIFSRYGKLDLSVFILFLSVFGGLAAWGVFGAILGPLVVRLAIEALSLVREEREAERLIDRP